MASQDDLSAWAKKIKKLAKTEEPKIIAATLNRLATAANTAQGLALRRDFKLRNKFTLRSLKMFKASPKPDLAKIDAYVGSKSPYLDEQESGGVAETRSGRPTKTMPSLKARGGSWGKAIRPAYRWGKVHLGKNSPYFVLRPAGKLLRSSYIFTRKAGRLVRVRKLLNESIKLKATHWHSNAVGRFATQPKFASVYIDEASKALTRLGAK